MHAGMLTLAFICIVATVMAQVILHYKSIFPQSILRLASKARGYTEPTGFVAAIAGLIMLVLSGITGMYSWPVEPLLESPEIRNKITLTAFATVLWSIVIFTRSRYGRELWDSTPTATAYTLMAIVAFGFIAAAGCLGAHVTVGESVLDPVLEWIGIDLGEDFILPFGVATILAIFSFVVVIAAIIVAKKYNLGAERLSPTRNGAESSYWKKRD